MAEIESIVEPNSVTDDIGQEPVAFVCVHEPILAISGSLLARTLVAYLNYHLPPDLRFRQGQACIEA